MASAPWAFFSPFSWAWEFGVGALAAVLLIASERRGSRWLASPLAGIGAWLGLLGIVVLAFAFDAATSFPGPSAALPVLSTALVMLGGAGGSWSPRALLSLRLMQFLGLISYSVYLVHWPLILVPQLSVHFPPPIGGWAMLLLAATSVPLGYLMLRLVEDPVRRSAFLASRRAVSPCWVQSWSRCWWRRVAGSAPVWSRRCH